MSKVFYRRLKYVCTKEERWVTSRSSSSGTTRHWCTTGKCNSFPQRSGSCCAWGWIARRHHGHTGISAQGLPHAEGDVMPLHHAPSIYKDEELCCIRIAALKRRMHFFGSPIIHFIRVDLVPCDHYGCPVNKKHVLRGVCKVRCAKRRRSTALTVKRPLAQPSKQCCHPNCFLLKARDALKR